MASVDLDLKIALIDEDEFSGYQQWTPSNSKLPSEAVVSLINWASAEIKEYCGGRIFIIPSVQIQEVFDGDSTKDYYTRHGKISDKGDVKIYRWESTAWVEKTETYYTLVVEEDKGRIYFNQGAMFETGQDNWRLDYKPGFALTDVPADLKGVCKQIVHRLLKLSEGREGLSSEAFAESTNSYNLTELLTGDLKSRLKRYKRRFL